MSIFGYDQIGDADVFGAGYKVGSKFTLTEDGYMSKISFYGRSVSGTKSIKCAIYANTGGVPVALLGYTTENTNMTTTPGWLDCSFASPLFLTAGVYWLVAIGSGGYYEYRTVLGSYPCWALRWSVTYADEFANPFGAPEALDTYAVSIYATYSLPSSNTGNMFSAF